MMKPIRLLALALLVCGAAQAQQAMTPVGLWKTVDDETKTEKSLVRIAAEADGALTGKVEKLLEPSRQGAVCVACGGALKDKPVVGMTILSGVKQSGGEAVWEGGQILDPNNGKTYKVRLRPTDGGARLEVRGYLGPFYRTQVWQRVE